MTAVCMSQSGYGWRFLCFKGCLLQGLNRIFAVYSASWSAWVLEGLSGISVGTFLVDFLALVANLSGRKLRVRETGLGPGV